MALIDGTFAGPRCRQAPRPGSTGRRGLRVWRRSLRRQGTKTVQAVLSEIGPAVIGLSADDQLVDQALGEDWASQVPAGWQRDLGVCSLLPRRRRGVMSGAKRALFCRYR